jgi:hypothetical protein
VLTAHNMIDLVREAGIVVMDQTVFAAVISAPRYFGPECRANITGPERGFGEPLL